MSYSSFYIIKWAYHDSRASVYFLIWKTSPHRPILPSPFYGRDGFLFVASWLSNVGNYLASLCFFFCLTILSCLFLVAVGLFLSHHRGTYDPNDFYQLRCCLLLPTCLVFFQPVSLIVT